METIDLKDALRQFTGTENWYRHPLGNMLYTDGVQYFAEAAGCYWFLDIVATELMEIQNGGEHFVFIEMDVQDGEADLRATDGNDRELWSRHIKFTDCPTGQWRFYLVDGVLLLPSEY